MAEDKENITFLFPLTISIHRCTWPGSSGIIMTAYENKHIFITLSSLSLQNALNQSIVAEKCIDIIMLNACQWLVKAATSS